MSIFSPRPMQRLPHIDTFIANTCARIKEEGTIPCYYPDEDIIHIPHHTRFSDSHERTKVQSYYHCVFHELGHWSGAEHRLGRDLSGERGSFAFAYEEMIAEACAIFLGSKLNLTKINAEYMQAYMAPLGNDFDAVDRALKEAYRAVEYLEYLAR